MSLSPLEADQKVVGYIKHKTAQQQYEQYFLIIHYGFREVIRYTAKTMPVHILPHVRKAEFEFERG